MCVLSLCLLLFQIPEEMNRCRNSYVEQALLPQRLEELAGDEAGRGGCRAYLQDSLDTLLKEAKDKFKGYDSCSTPEHAELAYRKVRNHVWTLGCDGFQDRERKSTFLLLCLAQKRPVTLLPVVLMSASCSSEQGVEKQPLGFPVLKLLRVKMARLLLLSPSPSLDSVPG